MTKLNQQFWTKRYKTNQTGWDIGYPSPPIIDYCNQLKDKTINILIPGAGNAYELEYLLNNGFQNVYVLDIVSEVLESVKKRIPDIPDDNFICQNFFDHNDKYDLILEQTFFCALEPHLRKKYCLHCHEVLNQKGRVAGVLFDFPLSEHGPPFGGSEQEYRDLFNARFKIIKLESCYNSIPPRSGNELFFELEKK